MVAPVVRVSRDESGKPQCEQINRGNSELIRGGGTVIVFVFSLATVRYTMMLKVPATSCLVLLLSDESAYEGPTAKRLFGEVDLSEGQPMVELLGEYLELGMEEVMNRKFGVRHFCHQYLTEYPDAQVMVLGGGLDPFSIDVAECYPSTTVFDVDMANLDIKQKINTSLGGPDVRFCDADLTDIANLVPALESQGWDASRPTLLVAEGISYYVPKPVFCAILRALRTPGGALVLEYSLPPEEVVDEEALEASTRFYGQLQDLLGMTFPLQRYGADEVATLATQLGGRLTQTLGSHELELGRTGESIRMQDSDDGVIRVSMIRLQAG